MSTLVKPINMTASNQEALFVEDEKIKAELEMVESRTGLGEMPDDALADFGFAVDRLHDPTNFDHTSIEAMLETYHFRDLSKSKLFRLAKKIFGDKMDSKYRIRNRTFNLVGLKKGTPVVTGNRTEDTRPSYMHELPEERVEEEDEDLVDINDLRLRKQKAGAISKQNVMTVQDNLPSEEAISEYNSWLEERRNLRNDINSVGLSESWLRNKKDKTEMEALLYQQLLEEKYSATIIQRQKEMAQAAARAEAERLASLSIPRIRRPSPIAIRKLDTFLRTNKLRLIDIFSAIDKDKNWHLSREEFKNAVKQLLGCERDKYGMDISPSLLEDLIITLDVDQSGEVSYKELVKGLELYQKEKRDVMKKGLPMPQDDAEDDEGDTRTSSPVKSAPNSRQPSGKASSSEHAPSRRASANRRQSRGSSASTLLTTPDIDVQESKLVLKSQETQVDLRKRDKNFLRYSSKENKRILSSATGQSRSSAPSRAQSKMAVFKTGYKPVDDHCKPSRLEGDTGAMVDEFRQLKLKEYHSIIMLCEKEGVVLSQNLLDSVLLHPGDKTTRQMLRQGIRQPGASLPLSRHFAEPPKKPRTPIEIRNKGKIKRGKDGQLLIDYKHMFPSLAKSNPVGSKVQLSTGKAVIARKVDCWMTFEEYEEMTQSHYTTRYVQMKPDKNKSDATWPGYMLDKMRVYLDHDRTSDQSNALFHGVKRTRKAYHGYDNDLNNWQVSDAGYLRQGDLRDPKKQYSSNNLQPLHEASYSSKNHFVHKNTNGLTMHTNHN